MQSAFIIQRHRQSPFFFKRPVIRRPLTPGQLFRKIPAHQNDDKSFSAISPGEIFLNALRYKHSKEINYTDIEKATVVKPDNFTHCDFFAEDDTELKKNILKDFEKLTPDKVSDMTNIALNICLKKILELDNGNRLEKPLSSWLAYFTEFFDCHYNALEIVSSSQREIAIAVISEYISEGNGKPLPHPYDIWKENKVKINKLFSGENFEEAKYLTAKERKDLLTSPLREVRGGKLRYNFLADIYLDNAKRRKWFEDWTGELADKTDKGINLSPEDLHKIQDLLKESEHVSWVDKKMLAKLNYLGNIEANCAVRTENNDNAYNVTDALSDVTFIDTSNDKTVERNFTDNELRIRIKKIKEDSDAHKRLDTNLLLWTEELLSVYFHHPMTSQIREIAKEIICRYYGLGLKIELCNPEEKREGIKADIKEFLESKHYIKDSNFIDEERDALSRISQMPQEEVLNPFSDWFHEVLLYRDNSERRDWFNKYIEILEDEHKYEKNINKQLAGLVLEFMQTNWLTKPQSERFLNLINSLRKNEKEDFRKNAVKILKHFEEYPPLLPNQTKTDLLTHTASTQLCYIPQIAA